LKPLQGGFFLINSEASRFYAIDLAGPNLFEFPRQPWSYKFAIATGGLDVEVVGIDQLKKTFGHDRHCRVFSETVDASKMRARSPPDRCKTLKIMGSQLLGTNLNW